MGKYDSVGPRLWAFIVDGLVLLPFWWVDEFFVPESRGASVLILWSVFAFISVSLYRVLLHALYGQTVGKMVAKVKVLDVSEERLPSLRQALIRDGLDLVISMLPLVYLIYLVVEGQYCEGAEYEGWPGMVFMWASGVWLLLDTLTVLTNKKRRALHDYMANTVVIRNA